MRWFCPSSMSYKLLVVCYGTLAETDEYLEVQEYGNHAHDCAVINSPECFGVIYSLCSITTVTNFVYLTTFAPVVYWIFLKNYFRSVVHLFYVKCVHHTGFMTQFNIEETYLF